MIGRKRKIDMQRARIKTDIQGEKKRLGSYVNKCIITSMVLHVYLITDE